MFPLHRSGDLFFKVSSNPNHQLQIPQDQMEILDNNNHDAFGPSLSSPRIIASLQAAGKNKVDTKMRRRRICSFNEEESGGCGGTGDESTRKKKHREVEKQRRQEMATLFAALRSLLPLEFIKGKRSISDHMNEAVNYIRHLQVKIKDLEAKRDQLKKTSKSMSIDAPCSSSSSFCSAPNFITVEPWCDGVQITISKGLKEEVFPLSVVVELLSEEGLNVVGCSSTQVKDRTYHKILCEAWEASPMDLAELQQKLEGVTD